jgi:antirestriction protein ArdC
MNEQTPQPEQAERKSRFAVSREVQTEFVESIAQTMSDMAEKVQAGMKPTPAPTPFCPATGHQYAGASMTRLMLSSMERGYTDDRWLTFNQLQNYKAETKNFKVFIRKGEQGVKLLRPENVSFIVDEQSGKWTFLTENEENAARQKGENVQRKTIFFPYTVFNASQIEGFPAKQNPAQAISPEERNAIIDSFVASSGVKVEHGETPGYTGEADTITMPDAKAFKNPDEYYAMKLRLAFHATAHPDRENRPMDSFEAMRGEAFSLMAGARLGLPMPMDGGAWLTKFEGVENAKAFESAGDAAKMLSVLEQFSKGEEPKAKWFPPKDQWPGQAEKLPEAPPPAQEQPAAPRMRA